MAKFILHTERDGGVFKPLHWNDTVHNLIWELRTRTPCTETLQAENTGVVSDSEGEYVDIDGQKVWSIAVVDGTNVTGIWDLGPKKWRKQNGKRVTAKIPQAKHDEFVEILKRIP